MACKINRFSAMLIKIENEKSANFNTVIALDAAKVCTPEHHGMFKKKLSTIEYVSYPLENHIYMLKKEFRETIVDEILKLKKFGKKPPKFLSTFLKNTYGQSLYEMFFRPFYEKIFQTDLKEILYAEVETLFRKTTAREILLSNFSQFDSLAKDTELVNVQELQRGTLTEVYVKIDRNSYTSVLIPDESLKTYRILCLSNFSDCDQKDYNAAVEISGELSQEEIEDELSKLPLNPKYVNHVYKSIQ